MKKILILLVVILIVYFGYQVYLRNRPPVEEEPPFVFDENYVMSVTFDDDLVSKTVVKTYYIYDNTKAVLEIKSNDRQTGEALETEYKEVKITDSNFDVNDIITKLPDQETSSIVSIYRFKFFVKATGKTYNLSSSNNITNSILVMFDERVSID